MRRAMATCLVSSLSASAWRDAATTAATGASGGLIGAGGAAASRR